MRAKVSCGRTGFSEGAASGFLIMMDRSIGQKLLTIGFSVTWTLYIRLDYIPDIWPGHFCKSKMIKISSFM